MNALHPLLGRFLALALLGIAVLAMVLVVVAGPVVGGLEARAELADHKRQLALFQQRVGEAPEVERLLAQDKEAGLSEIFYSAPTPALAAAQLQSDLRRMLAARGVSLRTTEMPSEVHGSDFVQVSVQASFDATFDDLASFLDQVQRAPRLIRFRSLDIRAPGPTTADASPMLGIRFAAYAYVREPSS